MRKKKYEPKGRTISALNRAVRSFLLSALFAGCANPGPPRPPSLQLPALVDDLSAERIGDRVLLRWSTPFTTTDGLDAKGFLTAAICRNTGASANTKKSASACTIVKRISVTPGTSSVYDELPPSLLTDPVALLTYRVEILNSANRSAGKSLVAAYAASGAAPLPVTLVTVTASEAGAILKWNRPSGGETFAVDLLRTDISAPGTTQSPKAITPAVLPVRRSKQAHPAASEPSAAREVHLRAVANPALSGPISGTVDTSALMGHRYTYLAHTVKLTSIDGHALELRSLPSPPVTLAMQDTFPPKSPTGLVTISGTTGSAVGSASALYIDLSWEPNAEADLAGYLVYRQMARRSGDPQGPLGRLTPSPIASPSYRDVAVAPGQRYIYSVTAVDASGNESAQSAKAQETAESSNVVGSPQ